MLPGIFISMFLMLGFAFWSIPGKITRAARQNCRRLDGTWSRRRLLIEAKHLIDLFGAAILTLIVFLTITGGALALVHTSIVPIPLLVDVFSVFDPDPVAWEANMEEGELGDLGEQYEQWSHDQGFSDQNARFWQEFLWHHWATLAVLLLVVGVSFYWFVGKFYLTAVTNYGKQVLQRAASYRTRDLKNIPV